MVEDLEKMNAYVCNIYLSTTPKHFKRDEKL